MNTKMPNLIISTSEKSKPKFRGNRKPRFSKSFTAYENKKIKSRGK